MGQASGDCRQRRPGHFVFGLIVALLLACFVGLQTASAVTFHDDDHGAGSHHHCCPTCQAGHSPVLHEDRPITFYTAEVASWKNRSEPAFIVPFARPRRRASRAPPTSLHTPFLVSPCVNPQV